MKWTEQDWVDLANEQLSYVQLCAGSCSEPICPHGICRTPECEEASRCFTCDSRQDMLDEQPSGYQTGNR